MSRFKSLLFAMGCLIGTPLLSHNAVAEQVASESPNAEVLLQQMRDASRSLNYELSYIIIKQNSIEPVRLRHAVTDDEQVLAHLSYLSGPFREVIQRGNEVSYFEPGLEPFTIVDKPMVATLPPMMLSDIDDLAQSYDFISMGRAREAGVMCHVVRVAPKDGQRYSYLLWIDETTRLAMRADLLDRDGEPLEQFRVVYHLVNPQIVTAMQSLYELALPPVVPLPSKFRAQLNWHVNWIPHGFESVAGNRHRLVSSQRPVESKLFSDGLFSFSVYVAEADQFTLREQLVRQGRRTLHSFASEGFEVSVVGDIPPQTAKLIAESVTFAAPTQP